MQLFRILRYGFSGGQTAFLQQKMQRFRPLDEQSIHDVLTELYARRVFSYQIYTGVFTVPHANIFRVHLINLGVLHTTKAIKQKFLTHIQLDVKDVNDVRKHEENLPTLCTYKMIEQICKYLSSERTQETIRNERLEHLLWWLYREFPYQFAKFEEVASNYTVKLYDIFQYMNTIDKLPAWEPYIRVSHMLKSLGHDPQCRTDMFTLQTLQKIDRKYFIYLTQLFTTQMYPEFVKTLKIHTSLPQFLCENYIIGDEIDFDKYLQRIQYIDNISMNEQINCTMDSISWKDLAEGWKLAAHTYQEGCLTEIHEHKFTEIFWRYFLLYQRKLETSDIPVQDITTLLQILVDYPTLFFEKRQPIMMRVVQSLYEKNDEQIEFFAANGYKQLLKLCDFLPMDGPSIKKLSHFLYEKIMVLLDWAEGDAQEILGIIEKKEFPQKDKVIEFLNKKISEGNDTR